MDIPDGDIDLLAIGETLVDFISEEETDNLLNAYSFRKYLGGSPANISTYISNSGGCAAVVSKTGIGAMGQFLKAVAAQSRRRHRLSDYGSPGAHQRDFRFPDHPHPGLRGVSQRGFSTRAERN